MKKLTLIAAMSALAFGAFAQGTIVANNSGTTLFQTNGAAAGGAVGSFYFALLTGGEYTGSNPSTQLSSLLSTWTFTGVIGTNTATAGRLSSGSGLGVTMLSQANWPVYQTNSFIEIGWSSSLGTSFSAISSNIVFAVANGNVWSTAGFFGISAVGDQTAGGTDPNTLATVPAPNIFGAAANGVGGINQIQGGGFNMLAVTATPEPGTLALAALGGASLLMFRRKK
jgi:hypothetical protein